MAVKEIIGFCKRCISRGLYSKLYFWFVFELFKMFLFQLFAHLILVASETWLMHPSLNKKRGVNWYERISDTSHDTSRLEVFEARQSHCYWHFNILPWSDQISCAELPSFRFISVGFSATQLFPWWWRHNGLKFQAFDVLKVRHPDDVESSMMYNQRSVICPPWVKCLLPVWQRSGPPCKEV